MIKRSCIYGYRAGARDEWGIGHLWKTQMNFLELLRKIDSNIRKTENEDSRNENNINFMLDFPLNQNIRIDNPSIFKRAKRYGILERENDYNGLQFYNNFHISRVDWWRSSYIRNLWWSVAEESLGFMKMRWGDANVHSVLVSTLFEREFVYYFDQFDYHHNWHIMKKKHGYSFDYKNLEKFCFWIK